MQSDASETDGTSPLRALTNPRSVALVGASSDPNRVTARPLLFLQQHGFQGKIFPVHPTRERLHGLQAYQSLADIPDVVDHAYILLGREPALEAFNECVKQKIPVVSILADGFADSGPDGAAVQERLRREAASAGIRLIGPNSMGVADTRHGFICTTNAAFAAPKNLKGRLAVLSQSGSLIGAVLSRGAAVGIGFSTLVSMGNEALSDVSSVGQTLLQDPETDAILLVLETIRDPDAFASFARAAFEAGKIVVAYVYATSQEGKELSTTHTGALVGTTRAFKALLADCGVYVVEVFDALFEAPAAIKAMKERLAGWHGPIPSPSFRQRVAVDPWSLTG